jgi:large subunit ribosomal protein L13Ae
MAIVIDNRGHMLGRITSIMVRLILTGNKVMVNMSRNFFRNKPTFLDFIWKRCNVLPKLGPSDDSSFQDLLEDCPR